MTTLFKIKGLVEDKNVSDLTSKKISINKINLNKPNPKAFQHAIQIILVISLVFLISGCSSNGSSEDSLVSDLIKELNSQRNISIYDDVEKIVFNSENDKRESAFKATSNIESDNSFDSSESLDSKNDSSNDNNSNSNGESIQRGNEQDISHAPVIVVPSVITLEVGDSLNLIYHVYDIDSNYILTWIDGWVKSENYTIKPGDEGVHSISVYASDYESSTEKNVTINIIRETQLSKVEIFYNLT